MGVVLHTKDGGLTWLKQLDGVQANKIILAAAESDANTHPASLTAAANLLAAQQLAAGGPSVPFLDILPLSATNLLMTGGFGMSLRSKDGGASWQSIFDDLPNPNGMHIYRIFEARKKLYFLGEQGFAVSRDDDGSFTTVVTPFQGTFFGGLFTAKGTLLFYGLQGTILRSVDQGKSWTQPASNVTVGIVCGIVLRDGRILLGDVAGDLLLSNDDGKSFAVLEAAEPAVGLAQAEDGSVIVSGPQGFERLDPSSFNLRS
jgi:photosystem II stability/assembly factor-like uncharacterized protein